MARDMYVDYPEALVERVLKITGDQSLAHQLRYGTISDIGVYLSADERFKRHLIEGVFDRTELLEFAEIYREFLQLSRERDNRIAEGGRILQEFMSQRVS